MANAGHRDDVIKARHVASFAVKHIHRLPGAQLHGYLSRPRDAAVSDNGVDAAQARGAFAHRPGRQPPAVAKAAYAVNHHDFFIARQPVVLQTIVGDDKLQVVYGKQRPHRIAAPGETATGAPVR